MSQLFAHPLFRNILLFFAIVGLLVFCIDKSRQNQRTRNTLYNCVYVLYAGAVLKLLHIIDIMLPLNFFVCQLVGLVVVLLSVVGYWFYVKPQADIPYNKIFYWIGWGVLGLAALLQVGFVFMALHQ